MRVLRWFDVFGSRGSQASSGRTAKRRRETNQHSAAWRRQGVRNLSLELLEDRALLSVLKTGFCGETSSGIPWTTT